MGSLLFWLAACAAVVAGLTVVVVVFVARSIGREGVEPGPSLPDFVVVDCGDQIHFVPAGEAGHVIGTDPCPCHPRKTENRRRSGRRVVYVDHQILARHSTVGG
jgi:hypothetical protein